MSFTFLECLTLYDECRTLVLRCVVLLSVNVIHTNTPKYLEPQILVIDQNDAEKNDDGPGQGTDAEC